MENGLLYILAFSAMAIALFACILPQAQLYSEIVGTPDLSNLARGEAVSLYFWDSNPTDLANATDGNLEVGTTVGYKDVGAYGAAGAVYFDTGELGVYRVTARITIKSNTSDWRAVALYGTDEIIWTDFYGGSLNHFAIYCTANTPITFSLSGIFAGKVVGIRWYAGGVAGRISGSVLELCVYREET